MTEVAQQAQLDEPERRHLEKIVKQLRERAEETVEYWVHSKLNLAEEGAEAPANLSAEEQELRGRVEEAIQREQAGERSWAKARDLYVKGVGYTLVNRLAALRCMEVRGFLDRSPTRFRDDGVTPAADRLITDYFLPREAGIWTAFLVACQERSEEIEILFDLSDPYSLLYGDLTGWDGEAEELAWSDDLQSSLVDLLQDLGGLLDEVDDAVWRADDVLGWVYEYYNLPDLEDIEDRRSFNPEDVAPANQFYTPHWVVRLLTDNSLGKLFLEQEGSLQETIQQQEAQFSPEERKFRNPEAAESIAELCTYLVPTEEKRASTDFDHPREIRVLDPAVGSAHFLLYSFDVLERIWWKMAPELSRSQVPSKILEHNLFGVDLDLRACQLAAFNLYLKARGRAEQFGADDFTMPQLGIVCADAQEVSTDLADVVFDEVAGESGTTRELLDEIIDTFESTPGLGSLLDPNSPFEEKYEKRGAELDTAHGSDLSALFRDVRREARRQTKNGSFAATDLRRFVRLLVILSQRYDVVLMNPPYGSRGRMPNAVKKYVKSNYKYPPEYYINFFEVGDRVGRENARISMLVPHSLMYNTSFEDFRKDFIGGKGSFDFLAEFGYDILDNATVGTVGTVLRSADTEQESGTFVRLSDLGKEEMEAGFYRAVFGDRSSGEVKRVYERRLEEFDMISSAPMTYWADPDIRGLYESDVVFDAQNAELDRGSLGVVKQGIATANDDRFTRHHWETAPNSSFWAPFAKGGIETWMLPPIQLVVNWEDSGAEIRRYEGSRPQNIKHFFQEGITYAATKRRGRRFGLLHEQIVFSVKGAAVLPDADPLPVLAYGNSNLGTYLMLCQTAEREWQVGAVSKLPWDPALEENDELRSLTSQAIGQIIALRQSKSSSPYFTSPWLLRARGHNQVLDSHDGHPHRELSERLEVPQIDNAGKETSLKDLSIQVERFRQNCQQRLEDCSADIDQIVFNHFGISDEQKEEILREIAYRTIEDPRKRPEYDPDSVSEPPEDHPDLVKRMLLHLTFEVVEEDDDGIVLLRAESDEEEADLLAKMTAKFEEIWGEYAEDRLQEVDEVLGNREPTDEPYPNLRHWLENDLFAFHCDEFEDTPILWELTTERLGEEDNEYAGFACLIDYHQLGPDVFDRLSARYLETRKAALRERQQSARRTAEGSKGTQAREARQEEKRCENALRQIDELETRISELTQSQPRDWADAVRNEARDLQPKVRRFRERLEERLETLDALHEEAPNDWFTDHFSPKFMEKVEDSRDEWIDALEDLEAACEQFARPADQPVEAHLYDLLSYCDDLMGSEWYSSTGAFFLNYYFSKGKDLAAKIDQGSKDRVTRREQLVADLARETDADIELGKEINEACQAIKKHMDSDWKPRALEEVRTPGYRPVKKHGVAINITPLAEKKLVPELVDKKVL
ncbi:hypothetical protein GGQ04_002737 [Salinibacter ruber]|uniref:BREX-5 system adenine-specific DNA-methyltransferase PglX n=1 Tax=Salinibacter ruber TaxID=146919 RepID=UPI002169EB0D|nr:BREX-5 system adenine-specific DNA-methyltransferase PglX [Salinibacter ruber]MCS4047588.1 hypothetical protein [Salinibacter ruber]